MPIERRLVRLRPPAPPPPARRSLARKCVPSPLSPHPHLTCPPQLSEILKLDKIADQDPAQILEVWHAYHANRVDYVGAGALTSAKYALLRDRMHRFPQFVLPLERDGGTEMFLAQFGNQKCAFTSLAEYQLHGEHSSPYSVVEFFPELMESKGMALYRVRHDSQAVEAKDCGELLSRIFDFYILDEEKFKFVETFNERPAQFDYTKLLEIVKEKE